MGKSKGSIRVGGVLILEGAVFSGVGGAWAVAGAGVLGVGFGAADDEAGPSEVAESPRERQMRCWNMPLTTEGLAS